MWKTGKNNMMKAVEEDQGMEAHTKWLQQWMMTNRSHEMKGRASTDCRREPTIKTVEVDTCQPFAYSSRRSHHGSSSPLHRAHVQPPATPSPAETRPIHVRSTTPAFHYHGSAVAGTQPNYMGIEPWRSL